MRGWQTAETAMRNECPGGTRHYVYKAWVRKDSFVYKQHETGPTGSQSCQVYKGHWFRPCWFLGVQMRSSWVLSLALSPGPWLCLASFYVSTRQVDYGFFQFMQPQWKGNSLPLFTQSQGRL